MVLDFVIDLDGGDGIEKVLCVVFLIEIVIFDFDDDEDEGVESEKFKYLF